MASLVTLAYLRKKAKQRADMENSSFLSDAEWNENINAAAKKLYDILTTFYVDYYFDTHTLTLNGTDDAYPLPDDFYKLLGVDRIVNGPTGEMISLKPYQFGERSSYLKPSDSGVSIQLSYIPKMPEMAADSDTFDGINGWEQFIILDAAEVALAKEESDTTAIEKAKREMVEVITASAPIRDAGELERVTDVTDRSYAVRQLIEAQLKYRIMGNNIKFVQVQVSGSTP